MVVDDGRTAGGRGRSACSTSSTIGDPTPGGCTADAGGAVGQTRLAVIDLATGDPPITGEDGSVGAVLNGEIYNFRALRARAAARPVTG